MRILLSLAIAVSVVTTSDDVDGYNGMTWQRAETPFLVYFSASAAALKGSTGVGLYRPHSLPSARQWSASRSVLSSVLDRALPLIAPRLDDQEYYPDHRDGQDQGDTVVDADALALPLEFYPARPAFMVPTPASTSARGLVLSGSGAAAAGAQTSKGKLGPVKEKDIWFAVKETVIAVFGDAGWALVGSSFNGTC